jgi:hypothetical protein
VDGDKAWTLSQSLKDFAKRSLAEIVKADDTASPKVDAYGPRKNPESACCSSDCAIAMKS